MRYRDLHELIQGSQSSRAFFLSLPVEIQCKLHEHNAYVHSAAELRSPGRRPAKLDAVDIPGRLGWTLLIRAAGKFYFKRPLLKAEGLFLFLDDCRPLYPTPPLSFRWKAPPLFPSTHPDISITQGVQKPIGNIETG